MQHKFLKNPSFFFRLDYETLTVIITVQTENRNILQFSIENMECISDVQGMCIWTLFIHPEKGKDFGLINKYKHN